MEVGNHKESRRDGVSDGRATGSTVGDRGSLKRPRLKSSQQPRMIVTSGSVRLWRMRGYMVVCRLVVTRKERV